MLYRAMRDGKSIYYYEIVFNSIVSRIWRHLPFLEAISKRLTKEWFDDLRGQFYSEQLMLRLPGG